MRTSPRPGPLGASPAGPLLAALVLLALTAAALPALGAPRVEIWAAPADAPARRGPIEARLGEPTTLFAVARAGGRYYTDAPALRGVSARRLRPLADLGRAVTVTWHRVEPVPHHVDTPPPNPGNAAYSNAVLFGPRHGQWLGYDTLSYTTTPAGHGARLTIDRVQPTHPRLRAQANGLGTMRYQATVTVDGRAHRSPGAEAVARAGIAPSVFRVSVRRADDLVGWLESLYNVPNVFGSAGRGAHHQTDRHQGADCADVLVGGARKAGATLAYTSVAGLAAQVDWRTPTLLLDGGGLWAEAEDGTRTPVHLRWGDALARGDLMFIKYAPVDWTGRRWDHIGMLGEDRGAAGILDGEDAVLHMGYLFGLVSEPAARHGTAIVRFARFKPRTLKQIARRARRLARRPAP